MAWDGPVAREIMGIQMATARSMTAYGEVVAAAEQWAARSSKAQSADAAALRELAANSGSAEAAKADKLFVWSRSSRYASRRAHRACSGHTRSCVFPHQGQSEKWTAVIPEGYNQT